MKFSEYLLEATIDMDSKMPNNWSPEKAKRACSNIVSYQRKILRNPDKWLSPNNKDENSLNNKREIAKKTIDKVEELKRDPEKHLASIWNYYRDMMIMKNKEAYRK